MPDNPNHGLLHGVRRVTRAAWRTLRQLSGDDAYERYVEHCRQHHPGEAVPDRREFLAARQTGKWSGIARCC